MLTPGRLYAILEDALEVKPRRKGFIVAFTTSDIYGERGRYLGPDDNGAARYGFTRRQCKRILDTMDALAREELKRDGLV